MNYIKYNNTMNYTNYNNTMNYINYNNTMNYINYNNTMNYTNYNNTMNYINYNIPALNKISRREMLSWSVYKMRHACSGSKHGRQPS